jgi:ligand-binding sensor protein
MRLFDILPAKNWVELEKQIHKRSGLNASVFDAEGMRITKFQKWANRLCPVVKATNKGQSFICSIAHQNAANQSRQTKKPTIVECDAGLIKYVVPIFVGKVFLGTAGGCGLLPQGGEVELFLIHKITDIDRKDIQILSRSINTIAQSKLHSIITFTQKEIDRILQDFEKQRIASN